MKAQRVATETGFLASEPLSSIYLCLAQEGAAQAHKLALANTEVLSSLGHGRLQLERLRPHKVICGGVMFALSVVDHRICLQGLEGHHLHGLKASSPWDLPVERGQALGVKAVWETQINEALRCRGCQGARSFARWEEDGPVGCGRGWGRERGEAERGAGKRDLPKWLRRNAFHRAASSHVPKGSRLVRMVPAYVCMPVVGLTVSV